MDETIVKEWLRSLKLECYAESFVDNGYDDLEICKQIDAPDLDAIGVVDTSHRKALLEAVQVLRVEGAASVYFTVEEAQAATQDTVSRSSDPGPNHEKSKRSGTGSSASTPGDKPILNVYLGLKGGDIDAYEAGRAELVRFPQFQLRQLLQESLIKDNVNLTIHPYTTQEGEKGILEGLASRYADTFSTHFQDVLEHLEYFRSQEYSKALGKTKSEGHTIHLHPEKPEQVEQQQEVFSPFSSSSSSLEHTNEDYPIYLPGKYNPSSCLSDAEEDQIYGFVSGGPQASPGYLNPRSQCIYELPPSRIRQSGQNGMKKKLGIGKLLKTLKRDFKRSAEIKNRPYISPPMPLNTRQICGVTQDLCSTPLVVLPGYSSPTSSHCSQSSISHSSGQSCIVTSVSAPGTPGSSGHIKDSGIQHEIERLKEQEIKRRREEQYREHEQILQDIREGLEHATPSIMKGSAAATYASFPNYMDERSYPKCNIDAPQAKQRKGRLKPTGEGCTNSVLLQHWYDEPPYESDPEEFLIGKENSGDLADIQNRLSVDEDVISLRTAGDITLSRDSIGQATDWPSPHRYINFHSSELLEALVSDTCSSNTRGQKLSDSQSTLKNYLKLDSRFRKGNDNLTLLIGNPVQGQKRTQSISSSKGYKVNLDLSSVQPLQQMPYLNIIRDRGNNPIEAKSSPSCFTQLTENAQQVIAARRINKICGSGYSRSLTTSDYEEESESAGDSETIVGRMRVLQRDMHKKISRLKIGSKEVDSASRLGLKKIGLTTTNVDQFREKIEAAGYSCYQRQNSLPIKLKQTIDSRDPSPAHCHLQVIGHARALVDYEPSPCDVEALKFKKGDIIDIISKSFSGIWKGHVNGKFGNFQVMLVEDITNFSMLERPSRRYGVTHVSQNSNLWLYGVSTLKELLLEFKLAHLIEVFLINGIEDLDHFKDLSAEDLDHMGITDHEIRSRILAAIGLIMDVEELEGGFVSSNWLPDLKSGFVRHTNGRVSLPIVGAHPSYPYAHLQESYGIRQGPLAIKEAYHSQIYENASLYHCHPLEENNLDHSLYSSSSTDTSSGYHSRPTYNINLGAAQQRSSNGTPDLSKKRIFSPPPLAIKASNPLPLPQIHSFPRGGSPPPEVRQHQSSHNDQPSNSYRAQMVQVLSTPSPTSPVECGDSLSLESTSC